MLELKNSGLLFLKNACVPFLIILQSSGSQPVATVMCHQKNCLFCILCSKYKYMALLWSYDMLVKTADKKNNCKDILNSHIGL